MDGGLVVGVREAHLPSVITLQQSDMQKPCLWSEYGVYYHVNEEAARGK